MLNVIDVVANKQEIYKMPLKLGSVYIKRLPHKRPFHVRLNVEESEKENKIVLYKVPILDEDYTKVVWDRPCKYRRYKILPLKRFKELIK